MDVAVRDAPGKGKGVFATRAYSKGETIMEFESGPVVDRAGLGRISAWDREHLAEVGIGLWRVLPEPRCYLNHACEPNAVSTERVVVALRDIAVEDEITIDYRLNAYDENDVLQCECDPARGRHEVIGDFLSLPEATQRRYLEWAPEFIKKRYIERKSST